MNTPEQVIKNKPTDLNKDPILAEIEANEPDQDMVDATTLANTLASTAETVADKPADTVVEDEVIKETTTEEQPRGGLASAVAKAKSVRSVTPKKTEKQQVKQAGGVKRF